MKTREPALASFGHERDEVRSMMSFRAAFEFYIRAKEAVVAAGFASELDWQERLVLERVTEQDFLREQAWVVLSSGMRGTVVAGVFGEISAAFRGWDVARIREDVEGCSSRALNAFCHPGKINAIAENCRLVVDLGLESIKRELRKEGPFWLTRLHYIGPVTCWHLAKNLGLDVVKPDRHLVRMAQASGVMDTTRLCEVFADATG
ncbi:MAG: hypothetical protein EOP83_35005, partial [Verrucomicrobiaceae bacterium]